MKKLEKRAVHAAGSTVKSSAGFHEIVRILSDTLTPHGIDQWPTARNCLLGGRTPLDALSEGNTKAVRDAAQAYAEGAYA